jgi:hypothetical protein
LKVQKHFGGVPGMREAGAGCVISSRENAKLGEGL